MATRIAYVTYASAPDEWTADLDLLTFADAAEAEGWTVDVVPWDSAWYDWGSADAVVVRSPWDYVGRYQEFLGWLRRADEAGHVVNPPRLIADNTDKQYLRRLERAGIPVVPTAWIEPGDDIEDETWLTNVLDGLEAPGPDWVVKAHIANGARNSARCRTLEEVRAAATRIVSGGLVAMVQPYLPGVEDPGETSVVVIGGVPAYAVRKVPALDGGGAREREQVELTDELREFAVGALDEYLRSRKTEGADVVAARMDLVTVDGTWRVMEAELAEPALYFEVVPQGAQALVQVIRDRIAQRREA